MNKLKRILRWAIPVTAGFILLYVSTSQFSTNLVQSAIAHAEANDLTPNHMDLAAGKHHNDPRSIEQRKLAKEFAAKQKLEMKAFTKQNREKAKAAEKAFRKSIAKNPDLSKNQAKDMIKSFAQDQKSENKAMLDEMKRQQKADRQRNNEDIKSILKLMFG